MLETRAEHWKDDWKREGIQEGLQEELRKGRQEGQASTLLRPLRGTSGMGQRPCSDRRLHHTQPLDTIDTGRGETRGHRRDGTGLRTAPGRQRPKGIIILKPRIDVPRQQGATAARIALERLIARRLWRALARDVA